MRSFQTLFFRVLLKFGGLFWKVVSFLLRVLLSLFRIFLKPFSLLTRKRVRKKIQEGKELLTFYQNGEYLDNEFSELKGYPSSAVMDLEDEEEEDEVR